MLMQPPANPILVKCTRSGLVEKTHRAVLCLVDTNNTPLFSLGNVNQVIFPRSAMKFFQILPLLMSGAVEEFGFDEQEIALMCASHNAEPEHIQVLQRILNKAGIEERGLGCGAHAPLSMLASHTLIKDQEPVAARHNNCSGKHAGFLALSKYLGAPLETYLKSDHPVQVLVRKITAQMCEMKEQQLYPGMDGCSAPNYGMPVLNLAIGFKNLSKHHAQDEKLNEACIRLRKALWTESFFVGGSDRYCSEMMQTYPSTVVGKLGADGVYALGFPALQMGAAIKIEDGALGPQYNLAQALIQELGLSNAEQNEKMHTYFETPQQNCNGIRTGFMTCMPGIFEGLKEKIANAKHV